MLSAAPIRRCQFTPPVGDRSRLEQHVRELSLWLSSHAPAVVVTGAGMSTESGIPDYRSPHGSYSKGHKPIQNAQFMKSLDARRRYWARSTLGYPFLLSRAPTKAHYAVHALEARGLVCGVVTQNVDGLHTKAGSNPVELHGSLHSVGCTSCSYQITRVEHQARLITANPGWEEFHCASDGSVSSRADGDWAVDVDEAQFEVPGCPSCGGILKPTIVFFGGSIDESVKISAQRAVDQGCSLLVMGTSLETYSAYRLALDAAKRVPVCVVNIGPTRYARSDTTVFAHGKPLLLEQRVGILLPAVVNALSE
eukprot:CAMPEP_0204474938 /NCGR_PEP_ID=MMETSP0471-20130131/28067_1 /ASSEMBLY_ACC=CAM_ASM_000602 /TAXON_ID=2969 /ORGANISM="Oxyrrhis marina" /LENGTH=308 /DNA_ID=CAMNT_0051477383 /DNA_START=12 /DNA_END=938 /DNA_ORIENTATION=-